MARLRFVFGNTIFVDAKLFWFRSRKGKAELHLMTFRDKFWISYDQKVNYIFIQRIERPEISKINFGQHSRRNSKQISRKNLLLCLNWLFTKKQRRLVIFFHLYHNTGVTSTNLNASSNSEVIARHFSKIRGGA